MIYVPDVLISILHHIMKNDEVCLIRIGMESKGGEKSIKTSLSRGMNEIIVHKKDRTHIEVSSMANSQSFEIVCD